jgi:Uma2 family endonuclease
VDEILSADFSLSTLNFEFPMATKKHHKVIRNLFRALDRALDEERFMAFCQGPEIFISLSGKYRIPDLSVTPTDDACEWHDEKLINPIVAIEVLSPSNKGEEFLKKLQDYKSIESLQEYWLIAQDEVCIERFVRQKEGWLSTSYDANTEEIVFPSLDITLKTEKIYKNVKLKD